MNITNDIPERIDTFLRRLTWILIILNILIGVPTIYYEYIHEETPIVTRDTSTLYPNEI